MIESVKKQTILGVKWTALEQFSNQVIRFAIGLVLARLLSPSDYGTVGVLAVFMAISGTFTDSGMGLALVRKPELKDIDCSTVFYFNIVVSTLCYLALFFCSSLIADFFDMPILSSVVKVYCLTLIIGSFGAVQGSRLSILLKFKEQAKISVLTTVFSGIVGISLAYLGYGVWALVYQSVLSCLFSVILLWIIAKWRPMLAFSTQSFKELFGYGSKLLFSGILWQIYSNLASIIIGRFYSAKDLGNYTRGVGYAKLPSDTVLGILDKVTFPILAKIQNDTNRLIAAYYKYIKTTSLAIMFPLVLLAALGKPIVLILLTDKWIDCVIYLQVFCFGTMFGHIDKINLNLLKVTGHSGLFLKLEIYKRVISTAMLFACIPFGVMGICVSKVIYEQIALLFNTYYSGKLFKMGYVEQVKVYMPYALMSLIACLPAYLITFTSLQYWAMILLGGSVSVTCYWLLLVAKRDEAYKEYVVPALKRISSRIRKWG